jgi:hypothetical protein
MSVHPEAMKLEDLFLGEHGQPTLATAFEILRNGWLADGMRNRETALHLFFLSWYGIIEPRHITGFPDDTATHQKLQATLEEMHSYFEPQLNDDPEVLYVVGLPAHMFWFMFENAKVWQLRAARYRARYRELVPKGLSPDVFTGRGAFGDYYARQVAVEGGFLCTLLMLARPINDYF